MGWNLTTKDKITFGYGLHSQMLPMDLYFREISDTVKGVVSIIQPSKHLDFSKSHHLVLGFTHNFKWGISFKTELFYKDQTIVHYKSNIIVINQITYSYLNIIYIYLHAV